jgi:hypothetical protein
MQSFFGHFPASEFFNSHACSQQLLGRKGSQNCLRDKMTAINPLLPVREVNVNDSLQVV